MEATETDSTQIVEWTVVPDESGPSGPLLVAMQPGVDVPASVEVVVMTENNEQEVHGGDIQTVIDDGTGQYVSVGAVEEVKEETVEEIVELITSDNKGVSVPGRGGRTRSQSQQQTSAPSSSSSESGEESSSDDEQPSRKRPKKRDFAHR